MNQEPGTSMRSIGSSCTSLFRKKAPIVLKARTTLFQFMKKRRSPDVTSIGTPIQRLQREMFRKVGLVMSPFARKMGASQTELITAPSRRLQAVRKDMSAPAAMKSSEPSNDMVT